MRMGNVGSKQLTSRPTTPASTADISAVAEAKLVAEKPAEEGCRGLEHLKGKKQKFD